MLCSVVRDRIRLQLILSAEQQKLQRTKRNIMVMRVHLSHHVILVDREREDLPYAMCGG